MERPVRERFQPHFTYDLIIYGATRKRAMLNEGNSYMIPGSFGLGVGYNVFQQGEDTKGWYQVLALKTSLTHHLFLHVGYQLSKFKDPNNLMLGLGWRF